MDVVQRPEACALPAGVWLRPDIQHPAWALPPKADPATPIHGLAAYSRLATSLAHAISLVCGKLLQIWGRHEPTEGPPRPCAALGGGHVDRLQLLEAALTERTPAQTSAYAAT